MEEFCLDDKILDYILNCSDDPELKIEHVPRKKVISKRDIKAGEYVIEYPGECITIKEAARRKEEYDNKDIVSYMFYYIHDSNQPGCIDASKETKQIGHLIEHGSGNDANLEPDLIFINDKPHIIFKAIRDIKTDEEFTYDYKEPKLDRLKQIEEAELKLTLNESNSSPQTVLTSKKEKVSTTDKRKDISTKLHKNMNKRRRTSRSETNSKSVRKENVKNGADNNISV